jgi:F-type H+-transporting ATPase subunit delta
MASVDDRELALGRIYAKAMLDLAEERGEADALLDELAAVVEYLDRDPDFERFLASPLIDEKDRAASVETLLRGRASDLLVDALQVINRKGRLGALRAIAEAYRQEHRDLRGLVDVYVKTAVPLTGPLRERLAAAVVRFTGKRPDLFERVDPAILGGMVVDVAGQKIDASVAARLREMGAALARRASEEIFRRRAGAGE